MMQQTPSISEIQDAIDVAKMVASTSRDSRARYRRRRTPKRDAQLQWHRDRCQTAAAPLRSYIGMIAWHDLPNDIDVAMKSAMEKLRYERRQIDKMLVKL